MDPFIGEIRLFPYSFVPVNWAPCDGRLVPLAQNQALYSLLGTAYGGNGTTTFGLPDLRGRAPISHGTQPGGPTYTIGQQGGSTDVTLTQGQLPPHTHRVTAASSATSKSPANRVPGLATGGAAYADPDGTVMAGGMVQPTGFGQSVPTMPPYLAMTWSIALVGIYPSRG